MFVTVCFKWCDVLFPAFAAVAKLLSSLLMTIECTLVCLLDAKWLMIFVSCLSLFLWNDDQDLETLKINERMPWGQSLSFFMWVYVEILNYIVLWCTLAAFWMMNGVGVRAWSVFSTIFLSIRRHRDEKEPKITKNSEKIWSSPKNCAVTALIIIKGTSGTFVFPFIFHMKPFFNIKITLPST